MFYVKNIRLSRKGIYVYYCAPKEKYKDIYMIIKEIPVVRNVGAQCWTKDLLRTTTTPLVRNTIPIAHHQNGQSEDPLW